jgi:hypothetical protein
MRRRLSAYAIAASAAGVGTLALLQPAEAEIVYTPAHHPILRNTDFFLDLNHDGKADFHILHWSRCLTINVCSTYLVASAATSSDGNDVVGKASPFNYAYALKPGARIDWKRPLWNQEVMYFRQRGTTGMSHCNGLWLHAKNQYLGLKFEIAGKAHFGWARLTVSCPSQSNLVVGVLTGYAYETIPNKPIIAGKTKVGDNGERTTLGRLALGRK